MSSIVGHCAAGVTVFLATQRFQNNSARWTLPIFVLLAICPDFDYFSFWLLHLNLKIRITHSILFCGTVAAILWLCLRIFHRTVSFVEITVACLSHLALDIFVGAHPLPLLWPLANPNVALPIGILPSAGHLALNNYYMWRNLLIESGVLLPVFGLLIAAARRVPIVAIVRKALLIGPIWLVFLMWSVGLKR
jgi:inner membrane protein